MGLCEAQGVVFHSFTSGNLWHKDMCPPVLVKANIPFFSHLISLLLLLSVDKGTFTLFRSKMRKSRQVLFLEALCLSVFVVSVFKQSSESELVLRAPV